MLTILATLLLFAGLGLCLLGTIGFLIAAFRESVLWGLAVVFLGGITIPLFAVLHWRQARGSTFLWLYGLAAMIIALIIGDNDLPWPIG